MRSMLCCYALRLLLGYRNYYAIHEGPYTFAHTLIESTLVQHKMAKKSCMALCCQNRVFKGTKQCYELHISIDYLDYVPGLKQDHMSAVTIEMPCVSSL